MLKRVFADILFLFQGGRKSLLEENRRLKKSLEDSESKKLEDYFNANTFISTLNGLEVTFRGQELVKIMAACFWDIVKDADNYVICDVTDEAHGGCLKVIITKPGKLTPQDKLKVQEDEIKRLKEQLTAYEGKEK